MDNNIPKQRIKGVHSIFFILLFILMIRLYFLQIDPTQRVAGNMVNHQLENISDVKYRILDTTGEDMITSKGDYVMVLDTRPFMLNNYEETLEDLMALNFIMKSEYPEFNYTDIMDAGGKRYYKVSEETYLKLNKLVNIKGIYTYENEQLDNKEAWKVESIFSTIVSKDAYEGSLGAELYEYVGNNTLPMAKFYLDEKAIYGDAEIDMGDPKNVKLTIDKVWQEEIAKILKNEKYEHLKNVGVIVSEVDNGKIRAMVQKDETQANINLAMEQLGYEPGSIFKTFVEAIGLEKGLITTKTAYSCTGEICMRDGKKYNHGTLTIEDAMEVSCNEIIGVVGSKIGYKDMMDYCEKVGLFDTVLNIKGNGGNEGVGIKPKAEDGMTNISMGQSISVTPIQMTGIYNTIVNDGIYVKPNIVEAIVDEDKNVVKEYKGEEVRVFSETTSRITQDTLSKVVSEGLGYEARVKGVELGGKTGTSTGDGRKDHGWFAGYFLHNGKKYSVVVLAPDIPEKNSDGENVGGGNTGAPIFADIVKFITQK